MIPVFDAQPGERVDLPAYGGLPKKAHVFEEQAIWAVRAALASGRALLVRGEPGSGKSQLARAAAFKLRLPLVTAVVTARTECTDLCWTFDAVARLAEAQVKGASDDTGRLDPRRFLHPGPLWWALDWDSAEDPEAPWTRASRGGSPQPPPKEWAWEPVKGCVLLIDEMDKAESDVPNALLDVLGNGRIHVPYLEAPVVAPDGGRPPLVIVTTNEERELPAAFVRRCMVLHLGLPGERDKLIERLVERGHAHFGDSCGEEVLRRAAGMLADERAGARDAGLQAPGQAEYLDLVRALVEMPGAGGADGQDDVLDRIAAFALKKNPSTET